MEKNNINKCIIILMSAILLGGCFNLDENPIGLLAPESYFNSEDDVEKAVLGAYPYFLGDASFGRRYTTALDLLGDVSDLIDPGTPAERWEMNIQDVDPSNGLIPSFWQVHYRAVGAANNAIYGLGKITIKDQARANALEAEARLIRAFVHFDFVRLFGDIPYMGEFVTDPKSVVDLTRTPVAEIYPQIIDDCLFAVEHLPARLAGDIKYRPSKGAAKTMLSSIYLTLGDYANAAKYAVEVINERANYGYELMADYTDLWRGRATTEDVAEYIWTIAFYGGKSDDLWGPMTGSRDAPMGRDGIAGWSVVGPSRGYLGMFDPADHRIEATFILEAVNLAGVLVPYTEFNWTYDIARPHYGKYRKWVGPASDGEGRYSGRNYIIYRLAEVYLIAAEALCEVNNGPTPEALGYLNKIRERARFGGDAPADYPSGMNKQDFINAVLKEKMLEFGGEYKRWWDIQRRKLGAEAFGPNTIKYDLAGTWKLNFNPAKNYLLPIPQAERNINPNLTQNPGYRD